MAVLPVIAWLAITDRRAVLAIVMAAVTGVVALLTAAICASWRKRWDGGIAAEF